MSRPLIDSEYIFGIHEPGGEHLMLAAGRPGWVLFTEAIGHDPADLTGIDFTTFSEQGLGVICRLNNGYEPDGTLPHSSQYENFARRVANFVTVSPGCKIWIIGNEMNYAVERPGIQIDWSRHASSRAGAPEMADPMRRGLAVRFNILPDFSTEIRTTRAAIVSQGEIITPAFYARCYRLCREAIHRIPGHENDQVIVGAVAPWNTQTIYTGNPNADWVQYFSDILEELGPKNCDGFALHAYTNGADPALITDETKLGPPFQSHHRQFRVYTDFMAAVPAAMRHLPAYITQTDQVQPWHDLNTGWVQDAYAEISRWNQQPGNQQIRALILYRWPRMDKWFIDGKTGVMEDFWLALQNDYHWRGSLREAEFQETPPADQLPVATPMRRAEAEKPRYQVEWLDDHFPPNMMLGETISVPITLQNTGSLTWNWGGGNPFRLGYHYYRNRRLLKMPSQLDLRTDIPEDVLPGETVTIDVRVALPLEAGNYTLEFDMVQEGITWFKEQNSPVLTRWITVEAPAPPVETNSDGERSTMLVPLFKDITTQLPRSKTAYARRSMNQVRYLVISHTGADPWLSLERIAQTHIQHGYPGIVYDFVVNSAGQIFRTSELEDVAQPDQAWSEQGVNICLTGNFSAAPPPVVQLEATGRLCAWLAQNLGLAPDTIVGLGELTKGDSPGATFYAGTVWKNLIVRQVQLHLAVLNNNTADGGRNEELEALLAEFKSKNSDLQLQFQRLSEERDKLRASYEHLQGEVADLRHELATEPVDSELRIHNIVDRLPRDTQRYVARRAPDVRYIVINHTGVAPTISWQNIARAHTPDWPGILYDFGIDEKGAIYQMQPFEEVAETSQEYLANAINIAFAGEFNRQIPTDEQIYAGGRLISWLMQRFAQVKLENIKGISEFIQHTSPGEQWLNGERWKELLLASVRRASGLVEPSVAENELHVRLAELEHRLESAQQAVALQEHQKKRVETENHRLQTELASKQQGTSSFIIPPPALRNITDQLPKHPTLRYDRRALTQITHIAVHHTAAPPSLGALRIAELHVNADPGRGKEPWPGIGYHFFIQADGAIEQTNRLETASYHVFRHNHYTLGVAFAGSFMNGKIPTSAQLRAGAHLIAWLMQDLHIPLARVWGHREYPENTTVCPGNEWTLGNRWRDLLFERIGQVQNGVGIKSIRHYLLFWQRSDPGRQSAGLIARQDLINTISYIARFRPTVGFNVEDAKYAEYVTIIGNEAGISATDEQILISHGCKVERVAGRDEDETSHILTEMAEMGRRFQNFDVEF